MDSDGESDDEDDCEGGPVKTIVKCGLRRAMGMDDAIYVSFTGIVEQHIAAISRMQHRASIVLLVHLLRLAQAGVRIPNLYKQKSTWWKTWLRAPEEAAPGTWASVREHFGPPPDSDIVNFDQVLAYAAVTFKTVVCNNAWVPLVPRLTRLTKVTIKRHKTPADAVQLSTYDIMSQMRSKTPDYTGWPAWASSYARDVRRRLRVPDGKYLHDEHAKKLDFHDAFMFNYWMQERLREAGAKQNKLSPIFRVRRAFVRLDRKVLLAIAMKACPDHPAISALIQIERDHAQRVKAKQVDATALSNPDKGAHSLLPKRPKIGRKADSANHATWAEDRDRRLEAYAAEVARISSTEEYAQRKKAYSVYYSAQTKAAASLFASLPTKKGWRFDSSIMTDGVAACLQYSRPKVESVAEKSSRSGKKDEPVELLAYDTSLSTLIADDGSPDTRTLVLGVDPGRTKIATVAYILDERTNRLYPEAPKSKSWSLSRSTYYQMSGTRDHDAEQRRRFAELLEAWQQLGGGQGGEDDAELEASTGGLRTADPAEVVTYLQRYAAIRDTWWCLALMRRESRMAFQRYSGKRKVLDRFFSGIRRSLAKLFPRVQVEVGYGQAYQSMKPTGRGEVAVPTTTAYASCVRAFDKGRVRPTDEFRTTVMEWESGQRKHAVYRMPGYKRALGHIEDGKMMPAVPKKEVDTVNCYVAMKKARTKAWRSGTDMGQATATFTPVRAIDDWRFGDTRYPEVRGLRFSTKTRSYLDRDLSSARTIARLRTLELTGRPRPAEFSRGVNLPR
jgi:hypothetical protein